MGWLNNAFSRLGRLISIIKVANVTNSTVTIHQYNGTVVNREAFEIQDAWFNRLLEASYDDEIKIKYNTILHETLPIEEYALIDVLDHPKWRQRQVDDISRCMNRATRFIDNYTNFHDIVKNEEIQMPTTPSDEKFIRNIETMHNESGRIIADMSALSALFTLETDSFLENRRTLSTIKVPETEMELRYPQALMDDGHTSKIGPILLSLTNSYHQILTDLARINALISRILKYGNEKILHGKAGTGKTHTSAFLVDRIKSNGEYVIFFKPKLFNGDNVALNERLLDLLRIPKGYTFTEILDKLEQFLKNKKKRCFIIIDALNETTKSTIGFSSIWRTHLQALITQIRDYDRINIICTLRTSYIESIWTSKPENLVELRGFTSQVAIKSACKKYFAYYKITPTNFDSADLAYFQIPLLLDLFCKITNETRSEEKSVTLNLDSYVTIFSDYISRLTTEVQEKLELQKASPIQRGIAESSKAFFGNNEATLTLDQFNDAFDKDDNVTVDRSIARRVLEGYLVFIKDMADRTEFIKHTQQEVGGFLIAKYLTTVYPDPIRMIGAEDVAGKLFNSDPDKNHQLRLDILKFLIALDPKLIEHLTDRESLQLGWWYMYNGFNESSAPGVPKHLAEQSEGKVDFNSTFQPAKPHLFQPSNAYNISYVAERLERLSPWMFDYNWTYQIYNESEEFTDFIRSSTDNIESNNTNDPKTEFLIAKFAALVTSTTIRELRDRATKYLIAYGQRYPIELLELTEYTRRLPDIYIYERLTQCCYALALIRQNDSEFVRTILPVFARRLMQLQFAGNNQSAVFNYIVTDSVKHLADLALHKNVITLANDELARLTSYKFTTPFEWIQPTDEQLKEIKSSREMSWPEPIGMDFGIYTIPRLINQDNIQRRIAIANVLKRVREVGYEDIRSQDLPSDEFKAFYHGDRRFIHTEGKVDRLGKKYSWKGFFDYAGALLYAGALNVFETENGQQIYDRLSDVEVDLSRPPKGSARNERLYFEEMIPVNGLDEEWWNVSKISSVLPILQHEIERQGYTMLHGVVEQRLGEGYKTRSYILVESVFIKNDENLQNVRSTIQSRNYDWDLDIHFSQDHVRHAYFGELYWADNIPDRSRTEIVEIPTGGQTIRRRPTMPFDLSNSGDGRPRRKLGEILEENVPERIGFDAEPTLTEYLWESESVIYPTLSQYYPSISIGKAFRLKTDSLTGKILDQNGDECFQSFEYHSNGFENTFSYLRNDILRQYMNDNGLTILYQIKQHSYTGDSSSERFMEFHFKDFRS